MLLARSIFLQVCLLLTSSYCQDYEGSYGVEESDDHSDVEDDSGAVDYSKYYSVDTSAPLVSAQGNDGEIGFTGPIEHAAFFDPSIDFGASAKQEVAAGPKNPFAAPTNNFGFIANQENFPDFSQSAHFPVDYFEQAQRAQQTENQEDDGFIPATPNDGFNPSGPTYISHNLDGDFTSDVGKVQSKPKSNLKSNPKSKPSKKVAYDVAKEAAAEYDFQPSAPSGKYTDYNTGKSSSTVAQYPKATGYYEKHTQAPTATPYQKYSFQPVTEEGEVKSKYLDSLISTVAPFNPTYNKLTSTAAPVFETQSSEHIPSHLKDKNCRRIRKHIPEDGEGHGRRKREAMNCFVCEDAANSSKFTQCSYAVEPEPKNDYSGVSERYSTPGKDPDGFRYKRYSGDEYNSDPYEYIRSRSRKAYQEDEEQRKEYDEYKIPSFYTGDDGVDKSYSEVQSEAITKNPGNCVKKESEGMTCTVCKDPKTGGNFEQCSYTSEPKEQKYAYVTEKKYDSDEPEQGSESKPVVQTKEIESSIKSVVKDVEPVTGRPSGSQDFKSDYKPTLPSIDTSKYGKLDFQSEPNNYKPQIDKSKYAKLEDFESDRQPYKAVPLPSNDNSQFATFDSFKPAETYKKNYHGHDKFKLSEQYNPDSKEDVSSNREPYQPEAYENGQPSGQSSPKKLIHDEPYDIPKHFAESTIKEKKTGVRGLEPSLYGSPDSVEAEGDDADSSSNSDAYKDIDEYHFKLFPEFSHEESQQAAVVASNPTSDTTRKDVEEVLAEFSKKDRSACKKAQKNGMTCYLCVDAKGIQHEECMYVSESKPVASHVAYHEVKQMKSPGNKQSEQIPAAATQTIVATPVPVMMQAAASDEYVTKVKYNPKEAASEDYGRKVRYNPKNKKSVKNARKSKEPERAASERNPAFDDEPKNKTPVEFEVGAEEGAFSAETKPVYSKTLGVKLPRYMIEKSEFEKEFDEFGDIH